MSEGNLMDTYLAMLDEGYFEVGEAFKGLADDHVWQRPGHGLLSIGEIAGHVAFWEATRYASEGKDGGWDADFSTCAVESPLLDPHFRYYSQTVNAEVPPHLLKLTAQQVHDELKRVHDESMAHLKAEAPALDKARRGFNPKMILEDSLRYSVFHIAYHTGQIYTARHLLGEETPDN